MNPWKIFSRGWKLALSNPQLAAVLFACYLLIFLLAALPSYFIAVGLIERVREAAPLASGPFEYVVALVAVVGGNWLFALAVYVALMGWFTLLSIFYFFIDSGVVSQLLDGVKAMGDEEEAGVGWWGSAPGTGVFSWSRLAGAGRERVWRVTVLAGKYALVVAVMVLLLFLTVWFLAFLGSFFRWTLPFSAVAVMAFIIFLAAVSYVLALHYKCALIFTVREGCKTRSAVSLASGAIASHPFSFPALILLNYASSVAVAGVFGTPAALILLMISIKGLSPFLTTLLCFLLLAQAAVTTLAQVAALGTYAWFCVEA